MSLHHCQTPLPEGADLHHGIHLGKKKQPTANNKQWNRKHETKQREKGTKQIIIKTHTHTTNQPPKSKHSLKSAKQQNRVLGWTWEDSSVEKGDAFIHVGHHCSGTSCPSQSMKLSRTCTCLWPLPCDGVTVPHRRISLAKGLLWAPVQQEDEIILMASSHLAFLLLQLFLLLLQRCSCL